MSAPRGRPAGGTRVGALLGLALLAVPGFLLGGLAGVVWQDPGLVTSYLLGRTEEVAWGVRSQPPQAPAEPEEAPEEVALPAVAAPPERGPESAPRPPARSPTPPPPTGDGGVAVQVGAFADKPSAERLAGSLRDKGYPAYLAPGGTGSARWRVRVGPWPTRDAGERAAARLKREERLPTWVLEEDR